MRPLLVIVLLFCIQPLLAQKRRDDPPPPPTSAAHPGRDFSDVTCRYINKYSAAQRQQFYPFNIADSVVLVSFRYHFHYCPIKNDKTVVQDSLIETRTLAKPQLDTLTDILYNNFFRKIKKYTILSQTLCFEPRNAILFYRKGVLKEYLIICFHCGNYDKSSRGIELGDDCEYKVEKLRSFFLKSKVQFGAEMREDYYPGENYKG